MNRFYIPTRLKRPRLKLTLTPLVQKIVWRTTLIVVAAYLVIVVATAVTIYQKKTTNDFSNFGEKLFPYPAAIVNGKVIFLERFRSEVAARRFYAAKHNLPNEEKAVEQYVIDRMVNRILYAQALKKEGITVTVGDIEKRIDELIQEVGGINKLTKFLRDNYGNEIGLVEFRQWVEDSLMEAAIQHQFLTRATVRHILIALPENPSDKQLTSALQRANDVRKKITAVDQFAAVAKDFSEDVASRDKGGELGTTTRGNEQPVYSQEFQDTIFNLTPGEISQPVRSSLGWHILIVDKREGMINASMREYTSELRGGGAIRQYVGK